MLPPKFPLNWHELEGTVPINQNPHWVDEFFSFSASRHRRSMSDSIAFMDVDEHRRSSILIHGHGDEDFKDVNGNGMEKISDELFTDCSAPNPFTPPLDRSSIKDEKKQGGGVGEVQLHQLKIEPEEDVHNSCKSEGVLIASNVATGTEKIVDPKRIKRILANRQSAQRSRVRKLQYISELERSVSSLQAEVSVLSPQVALLDHQRLILNADNSALKERIAALAHDKIFKDAQQEALRNEIERLRRVYYQQNLKMSTETAPGSPSKAAVDMNCAAMEGKLESTKHIDNPNCVQAGR